jgi:hypothetical protein
MPGCSACSPKSAALSTSLSLRPPKRALRHITGLFDRLSESEDSFWPLLPDALPKIDFLLLSSLPPSSEEDCFHVVTAWSCPPESVHLLRGPTSRHVETCRSPVLSCFLKSTIDLVTHRPERLWVSAPANRPEGPLAVCLVAAPEGALSQQAPCRSPKRAAAPSFSTPPKRGFRRFCWSR